MIDELTGFEQEPEALESWRFATLSEFFQAVEALPGYQACLCQSPTRLQIEQTRLA